MKPRLDLKHGIWRCRMNLYGHRVAGFGRTVQEAWAEYLAERAKVWPLIEQMGS